MTLNQQTMLLEDVAMRHRRLWVIFRARHDDAHHLAWSEPFVLERDEAKPVMCAWITAHPPAETVTFPGVEVMRFDPGGDQ